MGADTDDSKAFIRYAYIMGTILSWAIIGLLILSIVGITYGWISIPLFWIPIFAVVMLLAGISWAILYRFHMSLDDKLSF